MESTVTTNKDDLIEIDLQDLAGLLLSKAWLLILSMIITGIVGFVLSAFLIAPKYESTTSVYILKKDSDSAVTYSDTQLATQLTKDYENLITDRYVLETVIQKFGLEDDYEDFLEKVSVANKTDTRIIEITVKDENPVLAQNLANAIREVAAVHIKEVTDVEAVNVANVANLAQEPSEPSILKWTVIAAALGLFLSAAIVIIVYLMDDTIKTADDVAKYLEFSTLALIPDASMEEGKKGKRTKDVNVEDAIEEADEFVEFRSRTQNKAFIEKDIEMIDVSDDESIGLAK